MFSATAGWLRHFNPPSLRPSKPGYRNRYPTPHHVLARCSSVSADCHHPLRHSCRIDMFRSTLQLEADENILLFAPNLPRYLSFRHQFQRGRDDRTSRTLQRSLANNSSQRQILRTVAVHRDLDRDQQRVQY